MAKTFLATLVRGKGYTLYGHGAFLRDQPQEVSAASAKQLKALTQEFSVGGEKESRNLFRIEELDTSELPSTDGEVETEEQTEEQTDGDGVLPAAIANRVVAPAPRKVAAPKPTARPKP